LKANYIIADLSKNIQYKTINFPKIQKSKILSPQLNIHLIEIEKHTLSSKQILSILIKQAIVEYAQFDAFLSSRSTPDDELYSRQWQYENEGDNGQYDADIDAPEAWAITTGGQTYNGDEIVVAVLDGGININHEDIAQNIWTNPFEIPNNNIDDDANGFIDDYNGYNFINNNGDVSNGGFGDSHGTPVAGIIGATGNNEKGVSGVNWNVKIMMLNSNQKVSQLIAAYDYVYQMRKKIQRKQWSCGCIHCMYKYFIGHQQC
jgi:subtilisin family serine protease